MLAVILSIPLRVRVMSYFDTLITVSDLEAMMGSGNLRIVDCRFALLDPDAGRTQFAAGHLPGAVYADLDQDLAGPIDASTGRHPLPEGATFEKTLRRLGIDNESQVVAYDDAGGGLAARLWWMLRWMGHERVAVLDGGIRAWQAAGLPVTTDIVEREAGDFTGTPGALPVVTAAEVLAEIGTGDGMILVDARDAARYRGEHEPIDPVAGHVPGAVNLPFSSALRPDGTWKSVDELRASWQAVLDGLSDERQLAVMCGSGVTACHLSLAARMVGIREPALYAGSWSEWVADSARPVAADSG